MVYLYEKTLSLKRYKPCIKDEALRIHSFKANSKVFQQKFTLSQAARADANPKGTLFKECHCLFMSSKEAFRSYLMIFKCKDL